MSQPFTSGDQSIGISASTSILPMNTQDWSPLGWTGWLSLHPRDFLGFPGDTSGKEPTCQYRRPKKLWFNPWVRKTPLEEGMATHFSILAWKIPGQRSLACYSPWGRKELDTFYYMCVYIFIYLAAPDLGQQGDQTSQS